MPTQSVATVPDDLQRVTDSPTPAGTPAGAYPSSDGYNYGTGAVPLGKALSGGTGASPAGTAIDFDDEVPEV